ncbi:unnamed protein product [Scytosiphon promiscuus]
MSTSLTHVLDKDALETVRVFLVTTVENMKAWDAAPVLRKTPLGGVAPLPLHTDLTHTPRRGDAMGEKEGSSSVAGMVQCPSCSLDVRGKDLRLDITGHIHILEDEILYQLH